MKTMQKGFTLIELMIVIAIIGILASTALPAYREYIINSKLGTVAASITGIQRAVEKEHSRKGDGLLVSKNAAKALTATTDAHFTTRLGMRGVPQKPEGVSAIALVAPTAKSGTCASGNYTKDVTIKDKISIAGKDESMTGGAIQLTLSDGIDISLDTATITFSPVVSKTGIKWKAWSTAAAGTSDIADLACRWISENVNGADGAS